MSKTCVNQCYRFTTLYRGRGGILNTLFNLEREKERKRERKREREKEKERERQTDRQRERDRESQRVTERETERDRVRQRDSSLFQHSLLLPLMLLGKRIEITYSCGADAEF